MRYGIIDIGSNTIRLVLYEVDNHGRLKETENVKAVARLKNYVTDSECISAEGIAILVDTLKSFREIVDYHKPAHLKAVATAAIRQARNRSDMMRQVFEETGFSIRILSEYEEAYYGFLAVVNTTMIENGLTIDIGGGSTEITSYNQRELDEYHSFPFGVLTLKNRFIKEAIPTPSEIRTLRSFLIDEFSSKPWLSGRQVPIVGIGGSARNMAQVHQAIVNYPIGGLHQYEMSQEDINEVLTFLTSMEYSELQKVEGLSKDRADIIIPAVIVFETLLTVSGATSYVLSRKGLRDGLLYEELLSPFETKHFPNVMEESLFQLEADYGIQTNQVLNITKNAAMITQELTRLGIEQFSQEEIQTLKQAAAVYYLGEYVDSEASSQHTFYLLANRTIEGLNHKNRIKLALLASFKSKSMFKQFSEPFENWFDEEELNKLKLLGAILKMSYSLNATKRNIVQSIVLNDEDEDILMVIECSGDWLAEKYQAEKQLKHIEKALNVKVQLEFKAGHRKING